jgi:hypothetical protein
MTSRHIMAGRGLGIGAGLAAVGYAGLVAWNRVRYGKDVPPPGAGRNSLLDRFIPAPEVVEHHRVSIAAPADAVMVAAKEMRLLRSPIVRGVIRLRELAMGGRPDTRTHPDELLAQAQSIGWVVLAERAGREIVLGAVTMPWHANPVFRSIPAGEYEAFREPGYVKIVWSLRADPVDSEHSVFHTETRVSTTDPQARIKFQRYWSYVAPGVVLIRLAMLRPLKRDAERRFHKPAAA